MVDFRFLRNVPFHIIIMHPKPLRGLWGVTLPSIYESSPGEQAGMIKETEWGVSGRPLAVARRRFSNRLAHLDVSKENPGAVSNGGVVASSLLYAGCAGGGVDGVGGVPPLV
jgi:hypothetical protein